MLLCLSAFISQITLLRSRKVFFAPNFTLDRVPWPPNMMMRRVTLCLFLCLSNLALATARKGMMPSKKTSKSKRLGSPTTSPTSIFESSRGLVPICLVDSQGLFIAPNDPRASANDVTFITTGVITFDDLAIGSDSVSDSLDAVTSIGASLSAIADLGETLEVVSAAFSSVAIVSAVLSIGFSLFGAFFGLKTAEQQLLEQLERAFNQINKRLTDIQLQLRAGIQQISTLISDVALDELGTKLDPLSRAFNEYMQSSGSESMRGSYYEPVFRSLCNSPHDRPIDIFYDLYGYACSNCTYAVRKRADLLTLERSNNELSGSQFFSTFGNFIIQGMMQASVLHFMCLPPIAGSCVSRENDRVWNASVANMELAFNEVLENIFDTVESLSDWVQIIDRTDLLPFLRGTDSNGQAANKILAFLERLQPEFHFQVFVVSRGNEYSSIVQSCNKNSSNDCTTNYEGTGQFTLEDIEGRFVAVRYRSKALPLPASNITLNGQEMSFGDFYYLVDGQRQNNINEFGACGKPPGYLWQDPSAETESLLCSDLPLDMFRKRETSLSGCC